MKHINELQKSLNEHFNWNKARLSCFVKMLLALFLTRSVNLTKLGCVFASQASPSSRYRRLQRFFAGFEINYEVIAGFIFRLFLLDNGRWYLTLDRTQWKWGKTDINVLVLAIAFKGIALPIYWELLDNKGGNSDTAARIALVQKFITRFGKDCIAGLLADREFIGIEWFGWLLNEKIGFHVRLKSNVVTTNSRGGKVPLLVLFYGLSPGEERALPDRRTIFGHELFLACLKLSDGELLIVVTTEAPLSAIAVYGLRWEIETLFGCLKGRGFHFEDTHVLHQERIKKLLALLAIAFCWAHKTGEWRHEKSPIKIKKHGRPAMSLFRYGLDYIVEALCKITYKNEMFDFCLQRIQIPIPKLI